MKKTGLLIIPLMLIAMTSCFRKGCKDEVAANYDEKAWREDGSCVYESRTSFWFNKTTSDNLTGGGVGATELTVFINGVAVGNMDPADWKVGPDCGGANFTITNDMGMDMGAYYDYTVNDQSGITRFSGGYNGQPGACESIRLF